MAVHASASALAHLQTTAHFANSPTATKVIGRRACSAVRGGRAKSRIYAVNSSNLQIGTGTDCPNANPCNDLTYDDTRPFATTCASTAASAAFWTTVHGVVSPFRDSTQSEADTGSLAAEGRSCGARADGHARDLRAPWLTSRSPYLPHRA